MKYVKISETTHSGLVKLKKDMGACSMSGVVRELIIGQRQTKLMDTSKKFRQAADKKGLKLKDILKEGERIKEEIYNEWFASN